MTERTCTPVDLSVIPAQMSRGARENLPVVCVDPFCEKIAEPDTTTFLCLRHLLKAWREVQERIAAEIGVGDAGTGYESTQNMLRRERCRPGEVVYFIRFGDRIKIGYTKRMNRRLAQLPHDELLATVPGTFQDEKLYHQRFAHLRITGEWFSMGEDLMAYIETLRQKAKADAEA